MVIIKKTTFANHNESLEMLCSTTTTHARVVQWIDHLGATCSRAWRALCALVRGSIRAAARVRRVRLRKSNYVKIILTYMMIREIIPGRQQRVRQCPL